MFPVGAPYFLNLTSTDFMDMLRPEALESNLTPTREIPLNAICPGDAPSSTLYNVINPSSYCLTLLIRLVLLVVLLTLSNDDLYAQF
jgi:hypothetical protein